MIDIHAHILPGMDDGPENLTDSIDLATAACNDGTTQLVATPHTLNGLYLNRPESVMKKVDSFQNLLDQHNIPLTIIPGSDVALTPELIPAIDAGEVMTINNGNKYILVELQPHFITEKIKKILFELQLRGLTAVLTHPERDRGILENPELLVEFIDMGALSQITAMSLTGGFGKRVKEFTKFLLNHRLAHIIASDCHSMHRRTPRLSKSVEEASEIVGRLLADKMVNEFPLAVIEGRACDVPPYLAIEKKKWFRFWETRQKG